MLMSKIRKVVIDNSIDESYRMDHRLSVQAIKDGKDYVYVQVTGEILFRLHALYPNKVGKGLFECDGLPGVAKVEVELFDSYANIYPILSEEVANKRGAFGTAVLSLTSRIRSTEKKEFKTNLSTAKEAELRNRLDSLNVNKKNPKSEEELKADAARKISESSGSTVDYDTVYNNIIAVNDRYAVTKSKNNIYSVIVLSAYKGRFIDFKDNVLPKVLKAIKDEFYGVLKNVDKIYIRSLGGIGGLYENGKFVETVKHEKYKKPTGDFSGIKSELIPDSVSKKSYNMAYELYRNPMLELKTTETSTKAIVNMMKRLGLSPLKGEVGVYYLELDDNVLYFGLYDEDDDGNLELAIDKANHKISISELKRIEAGIVKDAKKVKLI